MESILNILNNEDENFDVKLEKKDKLKNKKVKKVDVVPLFKNKDDYSEPPHPNLLRLPFSLLEIAPKGSGKTTLLQNLLVWYYPYFDNIFIFSPTIQLDHKWIEITKKLDLPEENLFTRYNDSEVSSIMRQIKDFNNGKENKEKIKCLMIFDDCVEMLPKNRRKCALNKLSMNHRHYNISHIVISQSFKKLDTVLRSNTTGIILFNCDNTAERKKIFEELAGNLGIKKFEDLYMDCCSPKYGFMYINYDTRKVYQNFDTEIADLSVMRRLDEL